MNDDHLELAILERTGRPHIMVPVEKLPHKIDTRQALCGIVGKFGPIKYLRPNQAALPHNRDNVCEKCFTAYATTRVAKYTHDAPCLMHPVLTWFKLVPKGKSQAELEKHAAKIAAGRRALDWLKAKAAEVA